ncbi:SDR family oxidoreductase [Lysobacter niastensis]|uniref:SDR family oxidoreductase n=1 Tax=Lysobacter niastensis TaxID=380629 RepID=A0ABS0B480_9GAMM|nr:SDR family oxidoreductase [Lysobacter niastensis]MBF6022593.1 SDR family oxidoreductase [Lysobacter niastensis]
MKFVVIGGTGLIGSKVVSRLRGLGHEALAAAPSTGIDVISGEGLNAAMTGTDTVIDLANSPSFEPEAAMDFFRTAGRNVLGAEAKAGVRHHLALSIVGVEKLPDNGYFRAKVEQEQLIRNSGIPFTVVHSTQFFEFLPGIIQAGTEGATVRLSPALVQPIASEDVADAVARLALQAPANGIVEIAGPDRMPMSDLAQRFLQIIQDPREVVGDVHARYFGSELQEDTLVPEKAGWRGALDFERWLAQSEYARFAARA